MVVKMLFSVKAHVTHGFMHPQCAGISKLIFESLKNSNKPFYCVYCRLTSYEFQFQNSNPLFLNFKTQFWNLKRKLAKASQTQDKVAELEIKLTNTTQVQHSASLSAGNESMDKQTEIIYDGPQAVIDSRTEVTAMVTSYVNEEKEKAKRRLNLIVHNIPESASDDSLTRKKHDIDFLCSLEKYLGFPVAINQTFQLGKKGDQPRLLKISVVSESAKVSFFHNSVKLCDKKHSIEIPKIFFTPDLTPQQ